MDNIIEWIFSHIPWLLIMLLTIGIGTAMYSESSMTRFEYEADQVVSRSGGLTKPAYDIINEMSESKYHNMFTVSLNDKQKYQDKPADYGDDVTYKVSVRIPIFGNLSNLGALKQSGYRTVQNDVRLDDSQ